MKQKLTASWVAFGILFSIFSVVEIHGQCTLGSKPEVAVGVSEQSPLRFDVASVRRYESGGSGSHTVKLGFDGDRYYALNLSARFVISTAYGVDEREVLGGPSWLDTDEYDIEAKLDEGTVQTMEKANPDERIRVARELVRNLLADRFNLTVVCEEKMMPTYDLIVAGGGVKIAVAKSDNSYLGGVKGPNGNPLGANFVSYEFGSGHVKMVSQGAPISSFIQRLTQKARFLGLDRKIVDHTNLKGSYDFTLKCLVPWNGGAYPEMSNLADIGKLDASADGSESSLFEAMQKQLGLRLTSTKEPIDVIRIQSIERPTGN